MALVFQIHENPFKRSQGAQTDSQEEFNKTHQELACLIFWKTIYLRSYAFIITKCLLCPCKIFKQKVHHFVAIKNNTVLMLF